MNARYSWLATLSCGCILVLAGRTWAFGNDPAPLAKLPPRAVARLGSMAFGHEETINSVAISPDRKFAASGGSGRYVTGDAGRGKWNYDHLVVRVWQIPGGRLVRELPATDGPVLALDFSPDGQRLAAASGKKVYLWDLKTGKELQRIRFDEYPLFTRFASDGKRLIVNLRNKEIIEWDLQTRTEKSLWTDKKLDEKLYARSLDLSPDQSRLAILVANLPQQATPNAPVQPAFQPPHRLEVIEVATGKILFDADGKDLGDCIALSPDKKVVCFGSERLALWDVATKKKLHEFAPVPRIKSAFDSIVVPGGPKLPKPSPWQLATSVAFSPDGKALIATHGAGDISLYKADAKTKFGEIIHTLRFTPYQGSDVFAFSRDSKIVAVGGSETLRLIDMGDGKEINPDPGHRLPISDLRYSHDGKSIFTSNEMDYCTWNASTFKQVRRDPREVFKSVLASSQETRRVITSVKDAYEVEDFAGKTIARFPVKDKVRRSAQFSFDGKTACLTRGDVQRGFTAVFYALPECKELFQLDLDNAARFNFSPVRNTFIWLDKDYQTYFEVDAATGKTVRQLKLDLPLADDGLSAIVFNMLYSWDGNLFAIQTLETKGSKLRIWNINTGRLAQERSFSVSDEPASMDLTCDSRLYLYAQRTKPGIHVMELLTGKERRPITDGITQGPRRLATSPRDFKLVAGIPGHTALVWDLALPGKSAQAPLSKEELAACWRDLADTDAVKAGDAIDRLLQAPAQAVALLRDQVKPLVAIDAGLLNDLVADLGNDKQAVRIRAIAELTKNLEAAEPGLRRILQKGNPSPEARRRLEKLLTGAAVPDAGTLQALRAIEVLEKIGSADARGIVETVSKGAPGARVTLDATATLRRLDRRK